MAGVLKSSPALFGGQGGLFSGAPSLKTSENRRWRPAWTTWAGLPVVGRSGSGRPGDGGLRHGQPGGVLHRHHLPGLYSGSRRTHPLRRPVRPAVRQLWRSLAAVGFAVDVDSIANILLDRNEVRAEAPKLLVFGDKESVSSSLSYFRQLTRQGILCEYSLFDTLEQSMEYAAQRGYRGGSSPGGGTDSDHQTGIRFDKRRRELPPFGTGGKQYGETANCADQGTAGKEHSGDASGHGIRLLSLIEKGRKLILPIPDADMEVVLAKAADVITYIENGVCDLGVVGKDTIMECGHSFYEIEDLGFGRCRFALAIPRVRTFTADTAPNGLPPNIPRWPGLLSPRAWTLKW